VAFCEDCGHLLGREPNWETTRGRRSAYARNFVIALVLVVAMLALNEVLFGGAGYILYMPPVVWLVFSGYRHRVLSKQLRRRGQL
jgi:hypothetical protein